jgi:putative transposase
MQRTRRLSSFAPVHFAETCCIVALGVDIEGNKHPVALVEGSTENATLVTGLQVGLTK